MKFVLPIVFGLLGFSISGWAMTCELKISGSDSMQFDQKEMKVASSCKEFKLVLTHSGKLPKMAMGHNWVLSKKADMNDLVAASISAGLDKEYVAADKRIIAATKLVGGGESTTITFKNTLKAGEEYMYYCTFPGHAGVMKGAFILTP